MCTRGAATQVLLHSKIALTTEIYTEVPAATGAARKKDPATLPGPRGQACTFERRREATADF